MQQLLQPRWASEHHLVDPGSNGGTKWFDLFGYWLFVYVVFIWECGPQNNCWQSERQTCNVIMVVCTCEQS